MAKAEHSPPGLIGTLRAPEVGEQAPDFLVETPSGWAPMSEVAARVGKLVLLTIDSYRYHPG